MSSQTRLVDTILSALGRDDRLRRAYLRQRWQGLGEGSAPNKPATCDHHAPADAPRSQVLLIDSSHPRP